jgi:CubicO group peptidase (beta-lactamase class C family)
MLPPHIRARHWLGLVLLALVLAGCAQLTSPFRSRVNPGLVPWPTSTPVATATPEPPTPTPAVDIRAADAYLAAETAAGRFSGAVLVAQEGRILLEKGYGPADRETGLANTPQTRFHIGSLTKQFTAMAILQLQERGKLQVTDHISQYLPDCPAAWRDITIEHLLTHTSGLPDYFDQPGLDALLTQAVAPGEIVNLFRNQPLLFKAGSTYRYSNSGYVLLGEIIERASGESYADWIERNILTPLGMAGTTYGSSGPDGSCAVGYETAWTRAPDADLSLGYAAGGLCSTVEDLFRWDQALYTTHICSQGSLDAMFSLHVRVVGNLGYGYGWFVWDGSGGRRISHTGLFYGYSAIIARFPEARVTVIMLSNLEDAPLAQYVEVLVGRVR